MAIKSPKQKGSGGEHEIIKLLTQWGAEIGIDLTLERNLEQVRHGGSDVNGVTGLEIEVKRVESNSINSWWKQVCKAASKSGKRPMLCHRKNRQKWQFRVGLFAYECGPDCNGRTMGLIADLTIDQAERWFKLYLQQHQKEEIDAPRSVQLPPPPPQR